MKAVKNIWLWIFVSLLMTSLAFSEEKFTSPISLTASDGTGLEMTNLKVYSVVDGITAFTEVRMTFYNPEKRTREGRFSILLSENASISRFAMKINNYWQEGEVVEKKKARRVYEDFLHRKQDPALLEQDSGNYFRARVFPIPANSEKELIISYSEVLVNKESTYSFPLKGLPKLNNFDLKVFYKDSAEQGAKIESSLGGELKNWKVISVSKKDFHPDKDFTFKTPFADKDIYALRSVELCMVKFKPLFSDTLVLEEKISNWVILFDTSASQAMNYMANVKEFSILLDGLLNKNNNQNFELFAFDQGLVKLGNFNNLEEKNKVISKLYERLPLGASNLEKALLGLKSEAKARLLIVSDGAFTAAQTDSSKLQKIISNTENILRTDCLTYSAYKDIKTLTDLSLSSKLPGKVLNSEQGHADIATRLIDKTIEKIEIVVPDSTWFWPNQVKSVQKGDEIIVYAKIPENKPFVIEYSGKRITLAPEETEHVLLKRECAKARIEKLLDAEKSTPDSDMKSAFHNEVIKLSETERILSPYTALLVLETEHDYRRYNINRNALSDILTIGPDGINVIERKSVSFLIPERPVSSSMSQANATKNMESLMKRSKKRSRETMPHFQMNNITQNSSGDDYEEMLEGKTDMAPREALSEMMFEERNKDERLSGEAPEKERLPTHRPSLPKERAILPEPEPDPQRVERIIISTIHIMPFPPKQRKKVNPWAGDYKKAKELMQKSNFLEAKKFVLNWLEKSPADALALVALGEVEAKIGNMEEAARAYASLIDLFPSRADIRRWAGERLLEIQIAIPLAVDTLKKAKEQRPDHPSVYHLLAMALISNGEVEAAINVLTEALHMNFARRYNNVKRILKEDLSLIFSSTLTDKIIHDEKIKNIIREYGINTNMNPGIRFIMIWETDANDVDFHIYDKLGNHASYQNKQLRSGGTLYSDITGGYGPECFNIVNPEAFPYRMEAHYYSRGPMGYGMGTVQVLKFSKTKKLTLENRPFVIMQDQAFIDLGSVNN